MCVQISSERQLVAMRKAIVGAKAAYGKENCPVSAADKQQMAPTRQAQDTAPDHA